MVVKFLAPAAVTALLLSATVGPAQGSRSRQRRSSDSSFIQMASSLALLQVRLGKLAEEKGSSPVVRDFGKRMQADYAKANEELAAGAKQSAYPAPIMLRQHQQIVERFDGAAAPPSTRSTWPRCVKTAWGSGARCSSRSPRADGWRR